MITCKDFLSELNEFLDDECSAKVRQELEQHLSECPNCWVICDTTKKTINIYRGTEHYVVPPEVHERLITALRNKASKLRHS
ncbi:MAG TPA: zf-HC2 domain-containing protein [Bryobacteraceae bacterium]|nr:zf-HC2 domain-containing protein [Bryobacteraceae bacterium]HOL70268.1 zf-HC2 domain-containing protein [Bryobacteraceae bacterium]HOQ44123.1 zf-HC2 domain-containing protein [Bryobacteraceae bacterium]HPQ15327.1 zf-HC2 domain-containing protein [Bryobacteraceae bacterium]HPU70441.1 zf-HC2 domain-containing protein [Bryobacteraceae bacterium]